MSSISRSAVVGLALSGVWMAGCTVEMRPGRAYVRPAPIVVEAPAPVVTVEAPPPVVVEAPPLVAVEVAPPAAIVEVEPASPGVDFVWTPGYWGWRGGRHVWIKGGHHRRPHHGAVWVPHHWENRGGRWHLEEGHWR